MARLRRVHLMVAQAMVSRDVPVRQIPRGLGGAESTLRYHFVRGLDAPDGRRDRPSALGDLHERVTAVLALLSDPRAHATARRGLASDVCRDGGLVNHKSVHRLYCLEGLHVRMRVNRRKDMALHRGPAPNATGRGSGERWFSSRTN